MTGELIPGGEMSLSKSPDPDSDTGTLARQRETPILDGLRLYGDRGYLPFHTPGHKLGVGAPEGLREVLAKGMAVDLCLMPGFEDSRKHGGYLPEGERLAAEAWGAERAFFLTNGSSGGLHTLALALAPEGATVIVPRNAHRALLAGMILSGARPVCLQPEIDPEWGFALNVPAALFAAALERHPEAATVFVSSPSYNGLCADVREIATTAHARGAAVVVDEAWGAHLPFCTLLPDDALSQGADVIVTSVHKLLSGTSQASLIAARGERVDLARLAALVDMLRSTSMLVPILASIDAARMQMATEGQQLWARAVGLAETARSQLCRVPGLRCLGVDILERESVTAFDPARLTVSAADLGWAGYELEWELRESFGIVVESADALNVVMNVTHADTAESVATLVAALREVAARGQAPAAGSSGDARLAQTRDSLSLPLPPLPRSVLTPRVAFFAAARSIALRESVGAVSAEMATPYPPGVAVLCPGEEISAEVVAYLEEARRRGLALHDLQDATAETVRVVDG